MVYEIINITTSNPLTTTITYVNELTQPSMPQWNDLRSTDFNLLAKKNYFDKHQPMSTKNRKFKHSKTQRKYYKLKNVKERRKLKHKQNSHFVVYVCEKCKKKMYLNKKHSNKFYGK